MGRVQQKDHLWYLLLVAMLFPYVIARAANVPWVHDESTSIYWFMERGEFLPYHALWDAGNHFLSSALGILSYKIFGLSLLGSRTGSLPAYLIYAWGVWRLSACLHHHHLRWLVRVVLLTCPFLLDFFSLFRGYGLGMAFWALALDGGIRYHRWGRTHHLVQLLVAMALACFTILSMVPLWALIIALTAIHGLWQWRSQREPFPRRKAIIWSLIGVLPLMVGLLLSWELKRLGLLYHGSTEGFLTVTVASLSRLVIGTDHKAVLALLIILFLIALLLPILQRRWHATAFLLNGVLWADMLMRIGMALILGVNYPEDRAGLHLVPLALILLVHVADVERKASWNFGLLLAPLLLYLPARTIFTANLDHTLLWPEQSVPARFLQRIHSMQEHADRPLVIGAYHQLSYAIPYAARAHDLPLNPPDVVGFPNAPHDVRIADDRFIDEARQGFTMVDHAPGPGLHLLVREPLLPITTRGPRMLPDSTLNEFFEIWTGGTEEVKFLEFTCTLEADQHFLDLMLVTSLEKDGKSVHYHAIPAAHLSKAWRGDRFHMMVRIPALPSDRAVVHLWNVKKVPVRMRQASFKMHHIH